MQALTMIIITKDAKLAERERERGILQVLASLIRHDHLGGGVKYISIRTWDLGDIIIYIFPPAQLMRHLLRQSLTVC